MQENFVANLARFAPDTLIVSGLAYGIDVCAHRAALKAGLPTVGVLAHGLDRIYPGAHRATAKQMLENGGLLTEFMSGTESLKPFFVQRNRIVAGLADATVVVESASKGGSLITASLALGYDRDCFAFPGRVNDQYSQGCNELVSRNRAALITSAYDFVEAMNWEVTTTKKSGEDLQTELFPDLSSDESAVMNALRENSDGLQVNQNSCRSGHQELQGEQEGVEARPALRTDRNLCPPADTDVRDFRTVRQGCERQAGV